MAESTGGAAESIRAAQLEEAEEADEAQDEVLPLLSPLRSPKDTERSARSESSIHQELASAADKYDWLVEAHAFQEYPHALFCARLTQFILGLVVLVSLGILVFYYALGVVQIEREYYWYDYLQVPTLIICPDWGRASEGQRGFKNFEIGEVLRGTFPSSEGLSKKLNHTLTDCFDAANDQCKCVSFGSEYLERHDSGNDLISVRFQAGSDSPAYFFGFYEAGGHHEMQVPHTFGYGLLKTRSIGYLTLKLLDIQDKKWGRSLRRGNLTHFRDRREFDWEIAGNAVPSLMDDTTELLFGFKTFEVARDQTFVAMWSPFAIATVFAMAMSLLNNLNIFGLVWPLQQHPIFTQREPSILLRGLCFCCSCVKRRKGRRRARTQLELLLADHQEHLEKQI